MSCSVVLDSLHSGRGTRCVTDGGNRRHSLRTSGGNILSTNDTRTAGMHRQDAYIPLCDRGTHDTRDNCAIAVLPRLQPKCRIVYVPQAEQEVHQEHRTEEQVKDSVPDRLGSWGDDVGTLRAGPANGVEEKEEGDKARAANVSTAKARSCAEVGTRPMPE